MHSTQQKTKDGIVWLMDKSHQDNKKSSLKKYSSYYEGLLGDIYYWSPAYKSFLIIGFGLFHNFAVSFFQITSYIFQWDSLGISQESIKIGITLIIFNLCVLSVSLLFSAIVYKFFYKNSFLQKISLIFSLFCLAITTPLVNSYTGFFDNITWQVLLVYNVCYMIFLPRYLVVISFPAIIILMIFMTIFEDYLPFPVNATGFPEQIRLNEINGYRLLMEWIQLLWVWGISIITIGFYISLWRGRDTRLRYKSYLDELTNLYNRRAILEELDKLFSHKSSQLNTFSVAIIDLDFFKSVNDNYGHPFGDEVLQRIALELKSLCRDNDLIGRYGGEEFLMILPDCQVDVSVLILDRMRSHIEKVVFDTPNGETLSISISTGIAQKEQNDKNYSKIISRADAALYEVKKSGRNKVLAR